MGMFIPKWLLVLNGILLAVISIWSFLLATSRNPFPFPDPGSRIFAATSVEAKSAVVALLVDQGLG
jgi:hypothetical protein